jgi:two-component system OmpR family response regulator
VKVLVAEDDPIWRASIEALLGRWDYEAVVVDNGEAALEILEADDAPRLAILDWVMPGLDGIEICRRLRLRADGPYVYTILVTAMDRKEDTIRGLSAGADDYVVKPFAYAEVAARLRALARRAEPGPRRPEPRLTAGAITLDETARRVTVNGTSVDLSPREFSLLEALLRHAGQTLTRDQLLDHAWPFSVAVTPNAVDAYVHYLRTKLGAAGAQVETVRGVGYRLSDG